MFSHSVVSFSLRPHGLQHALPPCPSPSPGVCISSCSLHQWCGPAISSSDALFSFCPLSFLASGTFSVSCLFASDDQNTRASSSASVLPVNIQGWSSLRLTGLISLLSKGLSGIFSSTTVQRHQFLGILPFLWSGSHNRMWPLVGYMNLKERVFFWNIFWLSRCCHLVSFVNNLWCSTYRDSIACFSAQYS